MIESLVSILGQLGFLLVELLDGLLVVFVLSLHLLHVLLVSLLEIIVLELPLETSILWVGGLLGVSIVEVVLVSGHELLELLVPSWSKIELLHNLVRNVGEVQENNDHVRLLVSNALGIGVEFSLVVQDLLFTLVILNELLSLIDEGTNVVEHGGVLWIGENLIPWGSLDGLLRNASLVQGVDSVWIVDAEIIVVLHVLVLKHKFVGLRELNRLEEVWQVFVNLDLLGLKGESPLHEVVSEDLLDGNQEDGSHAKQENWRGPVNTEGCEMLRLHVITCGVLVRPFVHEDLWVGEHPVSIKEKEDWGPLEHLNAVVGELVVKGWWLLHLEGDNESLAQVLVEEVKGSDWEEEWHTNSVHHGDIDDIEDTSVLEMHKVVGTTVEQLVLSHRGLLGDVWVVLELLIELLLDLWDQESSSKGDVWHDRVDKHGLNDFHSDIGIPDWDVIIVWTSDVLGDEIWLMLGHVTVDNEEEQTSVEELGVEHSVSNRSELLRVCVLSYPSNERNNGVLEDQVDSNNDESNGLSKDLRIDHIGEISLAHWLGDSGSVSKKTSVSSLEVVTKIFLVLAEALHGSGVVSWLLSLLVLVIGDELGHGIIQPGIFGKRFILILDCLALDNWVLELGGIAGLGAEEDNAGGSGKHENDDEVDDESLVSSLVWLVLSILPNDIGWLRGFLDLDFSGKE